jgi:hypothetical protein
LSVVAEPVPIGSLGLIELLVGLDDIFLRGSEVAVAVRIEVDHRGADKGDADAGGRRVGRRAYRQIFLGHELSFSFWKPSYVRKFFEEGKEKSKTLGTMRSESRHVREQSRRGERERVWALSVEIGSRCC